MNSKYEFGRASLLKGASLAYFLGCWAPFPPSCSQAWCLPVQSQEDPGVSRACLGPVHPGKCTYCGKNILESLAAQEPRGSALFQRRSSMISAQSSRTTISSEEGSIASHGTF